MGFLEKLSCRDSVRELSNKRDSQGNAVIGNKYDRERPLYSRGDNKRVPQQHESKRPSQQHENKRPPPDNKRLLPQHENKRFPQLHENKRLPPKQHGSDSKWMPDGKRSQTHSQSNIQHNSHVIKTTSANTTAVSTAVHRYWICLFS